MLSELKLEQLSSIISVDQTHLNSEVEFDVFAEDDMPLSIDKIYLNIGNRIVSLEGCNLGKFSFCEDGVQSWLVFTPITKYCILSADTTDISGMLIPELSHLNDDVKVRMKIAAFVKRNKKDTYWYLFAKIDGVDNFKDKAALQLITEDVLAVV